MIREISAFELKNMMDAGRAPDILDVREPDEYAAGHIPGALNIPLGLLPVMTDEVDKGKTWHVICHSGARSAMAVQYLAGLGWNAVERGGRHVFLDRRRREGIRPLPAFKRIRTAIGKGHGERCTMIRFENG